MFIIREKRSKLEQFVLEVKKKTENFILRDCREIFSFKELEYNAKIVEELMNTLEVWNILTFASQNLTQS